MTSSSRDQPMPPILITDVRFVAGSIEDVRAGLLGYIRCVINDSLVADGICVRRTLAGELAVAFPNRKDRQGKLIYMLVPTNWPFAGFQVRAPTVRLKRSAMGPSFLGDRMTRPRGEKMVRFTTSLRSAWSLR